MHVRPADIEDRDRLLELWERSVRATHHFLTDRDIVGLRPLVAHAQSLWAGDLAVDVNEQNDAARRFYEALGFSVVGRSPTDSEGLPFPILHMKRSTPAAEHEGL